MKKYSDGYIQQWWRRAVLRANNNTCAICHRVRPDNELECHHLVKRRYRTLKHDWRNGVPVCVGECHRYADTATGTAGILSAHIWGEYLADIVKKYRTVKDYLLDHGITQVQMDAASLDELKTVASGGYLEAS